MLHCSSLCLGNSHKAESRSRQEIPDRQRLGNGNGYTGHSGNRTQGESFFSNRNPAGHHRRQTGTFDGENPCIRHAANIENHMENSVFIHFSREEVTFLCFSSLTGKSFFSMPESVNCLCRYSRRVIHSGRFFTASFKMQII